MEAVELAMNYLNVDIEERIYVQRAIKVIFNEWKRIADASRH